MFLLSLSFSSTAIAIPPSVADYTPNFCTLTFQANSGPGASMPCPLAVVDDDEVENTETVEASASIQSGMATFAPGQDSATVNIIDNDREWTLHPDLWAL